MQNYFEKLVRANFRFGRMCRHCEFNLNLYNNHYNINQKEINNV